MKTEAELIAENRLLQTRIVGSQHGLRPEAHPVAAALLDWDSIDDEVALEQAMPALKQEHDYLFLPDEPGETESERLERELQELDLEAARLIAERRQLLLRSVAERFSLRPEAHPVAAALLDWDSIEDPDPEIQESMLHFAMHNLQREHDYLFLPWGIRYFGTADGGSKSSSYDVDDSKPGKHRIRDAYRDSRGS